MDKDNITLDFSKSNAKIAADDLIKTNPKKYEVVERSIKEGLNSIISDGGDKFANQSIKVKVFIERLKCIFDNYSLKLNFILFL